VEPFAVQSSAPGLIRPAIELQGDLSAVLREGRVLPGEVLQTLDGGTLLIGIGRHRVPAQTQVKMQPGHTFLFQVDRDGETILLRVLGESGAGEPALIRALRSVLGQDRPLGTLLKELATVLSAESVAKGGVPSTAGGLKALHAQLAEHLFQPGAGGGELRAKLAASGLGYEARLQSLVLQHLPPAPG
jgi:hypothetical protein